ncbi:MAG: 2-isopropylmalate synthase, partial [Clostridia bacterium]|nr:2-isopropylmalate synthase [Clostridia bacterium]
NGEKYEGGFRGNLMNGKGVYTFPGGRVYDGYFENGVIVRTDGNAADTQLPETGDTAGN